MFSIFKPGTTTIEHFLEAQNRLPFSYEAVGATRSAGQKIPGFDHDFNEIELGYGDAVFAAAKEALRRWHMFPAGWTDVYPPRAPFEAGRTVAVLIRVAGLWWLNSSRIVYTLAETDHFGFAYGTLPGHFESGEEVFAIRKTADGRVFYYIAAFSRPRFWMARLAYPLARFYQRKFQRESKRAMFDFVKNH